ncbi:MAG: type I methionyl aminopeptidase [Alkalispirochaetaceae bacterium]
MIRLKNERQLRGIRESCALLSETLEKLHPLVEPGVTTGELDFWARDEIERLGGRPAFLGYHGFPGALCTSVNEAVIHGIPSDRELREGDILSVDCGIEYSGFYSDAAVTIPVGTISEEIVRLMEVTRHALDLGIQAAVAGNRVGDISRAIYDHVSQFGYGVVRPYCGHGVGLSLHEDPEVPNYVGRGPNPRLKPGMVIAIEPMINLGGDEVEVLEDEWTVVTADRSVSAHYEHTVAILADHTEILTAPGVPVITGASKLR